MSGRSGGGVWGMVCPHQFALYSSHLIECGKSLLLIALVSSVTNPRSASNLSDFCLLHVQCASCKLSLSDGWPPLLTGMIWSMHLDNGCGYFNVLSTGLPHIPHTSWVAYIHALFFSNCLRWVPSLSGLNFAGMGLYISP